MNDTQYMYLAECQELLEEMESCLLELEGMPDNMELVNAIFRAVHTIKGTSKIFGCELVESFTHVVENLIQKVQAGALPVNIRLIALLLKCGDQIGELAQSEIDDKGFIDELHDKTLLLVEQINALHKYATHRDANLTPLEVPEHYAVNSAQQHKPSKNENSANTDAITSNDVATDTQEKPQIITYSKAGLIRVDPQKLDYLANLTGELVIAGASANLLAQQIENNSMIESLSMISRLVKEIRGTTLQLKMVQIGETFNRFQRMVRDISTELGKNIHLKVNGSETELDRSVVEKISDPLMHLVRNAMDHGIEPEAERIRAGKKPYGTLTLNAYPDSGNIIIEVIDDGMGLNRQLIRDKAQQRGLIREGQQLSDHELINLIFEPGFSTRDSVSKLSGRGMGMDVVKKNITSLRGIVDVQSVEGKGSKVTITLPLSLSIIDEFQTSVGNNSYVKC